MRACLPARISAMPPVAEFAPPAIALVDLDAAECTLQHAQTLHNDDFASLQHAIETYLAAVGQRPKHAAIAVASPVSADEIRETGGKGEKHGQEKHCSRCKPSR